MALARVLQRQARQMQPAFAHILVVLRALHLEQAMHPAAGCAQRAGDLGHRQVGVGDMGVQIASERLPALDGTALGRRDLVQRLAGVDRREQRKKRLLGEHAGGRAGLCLIEKNMRQTAVSRTHHGQCCRGALGRELRAVAQMHAQEPQQRPLDHHQARVRQHAHLRGERRGAENDVARVHRQAGAVLGDHAMPFDDETGEELGPQGIGSVFGAMLDRDGSGFQIHRQTTGAQATGL
ncbi:hypothetical protein D3C71_1260190 [compost metagenome]